MASIAELKAPPSFEWKRWPETDGFLDEAIAAAQGGNAFAAKLASRMPRETGTQFKVWIDHLVLSGDRVLAERLLKLGFERQPSTYAVGVPLFAHYGGIFPPIALSKIKVAPKAWSGGTTSRPTWRCGLAPPETSVASVLPISATAKRIAFSVIPSPLTAGVTPN